MQRIRESIDNAPTKRAGALTALFAGFESFLLLLRMNYYALAPFSG